MKTYCITGGCGSLGSAVVKALVARGDKVRVVDNLSRGNRDRLKGVDCDIWDSDITRFRSDWAFQYKTDCVIHMAAINGTKNFYERPDEVLDVSIRGTLNVLDWCKEYDIPELLFVSSSEVYQEAPIIPTPEDVPLVVPDLWNPRYSYGGGKIAAELLAVHCGQFLKRMMIVRPHNIYGPDMGYDHAIPQFIRFMLPRVPVAQKIADGSLCGGPLDAVIPVPIQGTGEESRAFCYIDDFVSGLLTVLDKGENRNVYHIGTEEEWAINDLVWELGQIFKVPVSVFPSQPLQKGSPPHRCPDTSKIKQLGWTPIISLREGLRRTVEWYRENASK